MQIKDAAHAYFRDIFMHHPGFYDRVTGALDQGIGVFENSLLLKPLLHEEFLAALQQMGSDKAPGPNGFNSAFYKHFWENYGEEIFITCCSWLDRGYFSDSINDTNIALIPKNDNPASMKDWRPISLCNVIYKLVSKVLANRLNQLLFHGDQSWVMP